MRGHNVIVAPQRLADIESLAERIRRLLGYDDNKCVNMLDVLELKLPRVLPDFEFVVEEDEAMGGADAVTSMTELRIIASATCYEQALSQTSLRPQFTLAHELGHLLLHTRQAASFTRGSVKAYCNPEWQADSFAAAFLAPAAAARRCRSVDELKARFKMSKQAAELRATKLGMIFDQNKRGADQ